MGRASDDRHTEESASTDAAPSAYGKVSDSPALRLDVAGHDRSQQATLGAGTQHNYFGGKPSKDETQVSIAPPTGQRDLRFPLRGRDKLLVEILTVESDSRVRVIHGMGGCGKTSLVLEAAYLAAQRGTEVWWISAAESSRFLAGLRALSRRLGVTDDELRHGDAADILWRRLAEQTQDWLLVIDNADDLRLLSSPGERTADGTGWLRPLSIRTGLILVTSRDGHSPSWGPWCRLYPIGLLTSAEAAQVLADRTGTHHDRLGGYSGAESLANRLGRLPLALRIAGSFLSETAEIPPAFADPTSIRSYLDYRNTLDQGDIRTVFPTPNSGTLTSEQARGIIDQTWELTLDQLESRQFPEARRLLRLLSFLADAPIPYELLLNPAILRGSELFAGITGPRLWQVLQALSGFGLIELPDIKDQKTPRVIRLHPLVRDTSRAGTTDSEQEEYLSLAANLLKEAALSDAMGSPDEPSTWPQWQAVTPHALHVLETMLGAGHHSEAAVAVSTYAADMAANYQANQGLIRPAEATHRTVLQVRMHTLGTDHPDTIKTRHFIARRLSERADFAAAEAEYRSVFDAMRRVLGPEHPDTLTVQHNTAASVSFSGDYAKAEAEYRDVLRVKMRVFGQDHEETLTTRHEIARMMSTQGRYSEAEAEFRSVLQTRNSTLGPDHYNTLITRSQLARAIAAQGQYLAAEEEFREILATQLTLLGPEHLRTLWTRQQIALAMAARGDYSEAEKELLGVLDRRQERIPDHPDSLEARHELARILVIKGNPVEALAQFRDVLAAKTRVLGSEHPSTVVTQREIESLLGDTS
jgi:tetratricopeptide (TPR) repeat protein